MPPTSPQDATSIQQLVEQAQQLADFIHQLPFPAVRYRERAKRLLAEIDRLMRDYNEGRRQQLFAAYIAPQLVRLAEEMRFYRVLQHRGRFGGAKPVAAVLPMVDKVDRDQVRQQLVELELRLQQEGKRLRAVERRQLIASISQLRYVLQSN
jgi:hypothetical protein